MLCCACAANMCVLVQASSYTETFLMSPRSVGSSATRATTPSPDPIVPLSPATQHQSQAISHTLNHSTDPQEPAAHLSSFPTSALQDMRQPASSITAATQMQNETAVFVDVSGDVRHARPRSQWSHEPMGKDTGSSVLRVPFKAAHLQKLADATLTCKKVWVSANVMRQALNSAIVVSTACLLNMLCLMSRSCQTDPAHSMQHTMLQSMAEHVKLCRANYSN